MAFRKEKEGHKSEDFLLELSELDNDWKEHTEEPMVDDFVEEDGREASTTTDDSSEDDELPETAVMTRTVV